MESVKQCKCCKRFDSKECKHTGQNHNCEKCVEMLKSYVTKREE